MNTNNNNIYDDDDFFAAYALMDRSKGGLSSAGEWHQLKPLFPDLRGKAVLDLGCGYGWHCRYAVQMGAAAVTGIDSSHKMIETAMGMTQEENIHYQICGINEFSYPAESYDLVVSNLVLHYIENLTEVYENVWKTLKPGGYFLFNIEHPGFTSGLNQDWIYDGEGNPLYWGIDRYYYSGIRETNFLGKKVMKYHHTMTQIVNPLLQMGFRLEALEEVIPPEEMMDIPGMKDELRRPMMLLIKCRKE